MLATPIPSTQLRRLVHQMLLVRSDDLDAVSTAAFIRGWSSAMEVVQRTDLTVPSASEAVRTTIDQIVETIDAARRRVLDDEPGDP